MRSRTCGARLPVYILFAAAFFPRSGSLLIFSLYMTGILLSVLTGLLLRKTLLRGQASTFVMELPPYRMPTARGLAVHMWERSWMYVRKAGTVICFINDSAFVHLQNTIFINHREFANGLFGHWIDQILQFV